MRAPVELQLEAQLVNGRAGRLRDVNELQTTSPC